MYYNEDDLKHMQFGDVLDYTIIVINFQMNLYLTNVTLNY